MHESKLGLRLLLLLRLLVVAALVAMQSKSVRITRVAYVACGITVLLRRLLLLVVVALVAIQREWARKTFVARVAIHGGDEVVQEVRGCGSMPGLWWECLVPEIVRVNEYRPTLGLG
jgi:hypothetical protein